MSGLEISKPTSDFLVLLGRVTGGGAAILLAAGAILLTRTAYVFYFSKDTEAQLPQRLLKFKETIERVKIVLIPLAGVMLWSAIKIGSMMIEDPGFSAWIGLFTFMRAMIL